MLDGSARDIHALWQDPTVQEYLKKHNYALEQSPGL